ARAGPRLLLVGRLGCRAHARVVGARAGRIVASELASNLGGRRCNLGAVGLELVLLARALVVLRHLRFLRLADLGAAHDRTSLGLGFCWELHGLEHACGLAFRLHGPPRSRPWTLSGPAAEESTGTCCPNDA